jgi:hypothetical protein
MMNVFVFAGQADETLEIAGETKQPAVVPAGCVQWAIQDLNL